MSCMGCVYAIKLSGWWCCNYLSVTGRRRPCPPGKACTVWKRGRGDPTEAWRTRAPGKKRTWDTERAVILYMMGWTDQAIAGELGTTKSAVEFWRRSQGLLRYKRKEKEDRPG